MLVTPIPQKHSFLLCLVNDSLKATRSRRYLCLGVAERTLTDGLAVFQLLKQPLQVTDKEVQLADAGKRQAFPKGQTCGSADKESTEEAVGARGLPSESSWLLCRFWSPQMSEGGAELVLDSGTG